jgi:hypothetical protein
MDFREMDRINLALDRDKWWALVNTVMNLWVPKIAERLSVSYLINQRPQIHVVYL